MNRPPLKPCRICGLPNNLAPSDPDGLCAYCRPLANDGVVVMQNWHMVDAWLKHHHEVRRHGEALASLIEFTPTTYAGWIERICLSYRNLQVMGQIEG